MLYHFEMAKPPISIRVQEKEYQLPRYTIRDISEWSQEIMSRRTEEATAHIKDENQRREFLSFYPPVPPTVDDMRRAVRTPEGIERIVRTCLQKASVPQDHADIILGAPTGQLSYLAAELADIHERRSLSEEENKADVISSDPSSSDVNSG